MTNQVRASMVSNTIECYKVVLIGSGGELCSLVMEKPYEVGCEYEEERFSETAFGFPYFSYRNVCIYRVKYGFYSYASYETAVEISKYASEHGYNACVIRCEIPEGSLYYTNVEEDEYCSDSIRIVGIVE